MILWIEILNYFVLYLVGTIIYYRAHYRYYDTVVPTVVEVLVILVVCPLIITVIIYRSCDGSRLSV